MYRFFFKDEYAWPVFTSILMHGNAAVFHATELQEYKESL